MAFDPQSLAREIPDLDLYHQWDIEPEQAVQLARECEAAGLACDARLKNSEGATVSTHSGVRVHGNSLGFLAGSTLYEDHLSVLCETMRMLIAGDGERMPSDIV